MNDEIDHLLSNPTETFDTIKHGLHFHPAVYTLQFMNLGLVYGGRSGCFYNRIKDHESKLRRGIHENSNIQAAYDRDKDVRISYVKVGCGFWPAKLEQELIDTLMEFDISLNIATDAIFSAKGLKLSDEHKRAISEGSIKYWSSEDARDEQSSRFKDLWQTDEYRSRVLGSWKNLPEDKKKEIIAKRNQSYSERLKDPEFQKKLSELAVARSQHPATVAANESRMVPVVVRGIEYRSIREASKELGETTDAIKYRLDSKRHPDYCYAKKK